jgi:hypothetical protein
MGAHQDGLRDRLMKALDTAIDEIRMCPDKAWGGPTRDGRHTTREVVGELVERSANVAALLVASSDAPRDTSADNSAVRTHDCEVLDQEQAAALLYTFTGVIPDLLQAAGTENLADLQRLVEVAVHDNLVARTNCIRKAVRDCRVE